MNNTVFAYSNDLYFQSGSGAFDFQSCNAEYSFCIALQKCRNLYGPDDGRKSILQKVLKLPNFFFSCKCNSNFSFFKEKGGFEYGNE